MVQFGEPTVEAAMKLGREAAEYITGTFIKVSMGSPVITSEIFMLLDHMILL